MKVWSTKPGVEVGADAEQNVDHMGEYKLHFHTSRFFL